MVIHERLWSILLIGCSQSVFVTEASFITLAVAGCAHYVCMCSQGSHWCSAGVPLQRRTYFNMWLPLTHVKPLKVLPGSSMADSIQGCCWGIFSPSLRWCLDIAGIVSVFLADSGLWWRTWPVMCYCFDCWVSLGSVTECNYSSNIEQCWWDVMTRLGNECPAGTKMPGSHQLYLGDLAAYLRWETDVITLPEIMTSCRLKKCVWNIFFRDNLYY